MRSVPYIHEDCTSIFCVWCTTVSYHPIRLNFFINKKNKVPVKTSSGLHAMVAKSSARQGHIYCICDSNLVSKFDDDASAWVLR